MITCKLDDEDLFELDSRRRREIERREARRGLVPTPIRRRTQA